MKAKGEVNFNLFNQSASLIKKKDNAPVEILSTVYLNERVHSTKTVPYNTGSNNVITDNCNGRKLVNNFLVACCGASYK